MKLKREDWPAPVDGVLTIAPHGFHGRPPGLEATLSDPHSFSTPVSAMQPLFDPVLLATHGQGFLLRGWEVWTGGDEQRSVRHVSQVWFVVPREPKAR